jgi:hypothetical protein
MPTPPPELDIKHRDGLHQTPPATRCWAVCARARARVAESAPNLRAGPPTAAPHTSPRPRMAAVGRRRFALRSATPPFVTGSGTLRRERPSGSVGGRSVSPWYSACARHAPYGASQWAIPDVIEKPLEGRPTTAIGPRAGSGGDAYRGAGRPSWQGRQDPRISDGDSDRKGDRASLARTSAHPRSLMALCSISAERGPAAPISSRPQTLPNHTPGPMRFLHLYRAWGSTRGRRLLAWASPYPTRCVCS